MNSKRILQLTTVFALFSADHCLNRLHAVPTSEKIGFCQDYASRRINTYNPSQYWYNRHYNECMKNADNLIKDYNRRINDFWDRVRAFEEEEGRKRNAEQKKRKAILDNFESLF